MNKSYRVYIGSPPPNLTRSPEMVTSWKTVSTCEISPPLPLMTLEQAERRISLVYQNVIFADENEPEDLIEECKSQDGVSSTLLSLYTSGVPYSLLSHDLSPTVGPSLMYVPELSLHEGSRDVTNSHLPRTGDLDYTGNETTLLSEGSSIGCFPTFNFSLNAVSSLSSILQVQKHNPMSPKVTLLLGVLEVDGPSYVKVKTGQYAGCEVALLKLVVGDESGAVCKMIAWRELAELWGGLDVDSGLKRGDIILVENVMVSRLRCRQGEQEDNGTKLQLTASPNLKSLVQICYRTLPYAYGDRGLRPDLRLADSIPAVRRVREVVIWMERMAGIADKP